MGEEGFVTNALIEQLFLLVEGSLGSVPCECGKDCYLDVLSSICLGPEDVPCQRVQTNHKVLAKRSRGPASLGCAAEYVEG